MPKTDNHDELTRNLLTIIDRSVEAKLRNRPIQGNIIQGWVPPTAIPPSVIPDTAAIEADIDALQITVADHETRIATNESDITTINTTITGIESDISTLETDVTTLEGQVSSHGTTLSDHETRITTNESDIAALETATSGYGTSISNHETRITDLETDVADHETRITSAEGTISSHTSTLATHTSQISTLQTDVAAKPDTFLELPDTPSSFSGTEYNLLQVNSAGSAVTTTVPPLLELSDTSMYGGLLSKFLIPSWRDHADLKPTSGGLLDQEFASSTSLNWLNQGTASRTVTKHELVLTDTTASAANPIIRGNYIATSGTTWTLKGQLCFQPGILGNAIGGGLLAYESGTGKILMWGWKLDASKNLFLSLDYAANTTSAWTTSTSTRIYHQQLYLYINRAGSTINVGYSLNGRSYTQSASISTTTPFTSAPNNAGMYLQIVSGTTGKPLTLTSDWLRFS